jgi:hypothetical protein
MGRFGSSVRYIFMVISFKVSVALNANIRTKAVIINHQINERVCARGYSLNEMIFKASQVFFSMLIRNPLKAIRTDGREEKF